VAKAAEGDQWEGAESFMVAGQTRE
jgi:hypothetical protein